MGRGVGDLMGRSDEWMGGGSVGWRGRESDHDG